MVHRRHALWLNTHCKLHCITGDEDDKLSKVLANTEQLKAILPALTLVANPFHSASSLTSQEAEVQASDFKLRVFKYYFLPPPPPGLQQLPSHAYVPGGKMTCMVSKLRLSSNLVEAANILPKAQVKISPHPMASNEPHIDACLFAVGQLCSGYF